MAETEHSIDLYAKREKIFPREIKGTFQSMRAWSVYVLLGLYYGLPWLEWGERQAVLFDLPARKFHIFFLTFWPQDFIFLTLLLIMAALLLFFVTAVAGRVWCGFACPQTVWTELYVWIERWVEGSRAQQLALDKAPWTRQKLMKRVSKHVLWLLLSLFTGLTFVGYFQPIETLFGAFFSTELVGWPLFWVLFYGFATYGNAGFMREQVCKYMCPYARFQSAMFDNYTLIVAYDEARGEPRHRGKKRADAAQNASGDCIDCGICVQVCPTGIDIRDGLQYECIACAACIDGCNDVMQKVGLPGNLIQYSTQNESHAHARTPWQRVLRPRIVIYASLLMALMLGFVSSLALRAPFQVDILRDRNAFYRWSKEGDIENTYQVRIMNKSQAAQQYRVSVTGLEGITVRWVRGDCQSTSLAVPAGEIGDFSLVASLSPEQPANRSQLIELIFEDISSQDAVVEQTRFWTPSTPN